MSHSGETIASGVAIYLFLSVDVRQSEQEASAASEIPERWACVKIAWGDAVTVNYVTASCSCGLMDKAPPSGGGDCGFESRLGYMNRFVAVRSMWAVKKEGNK